MVSTLNIFNLMQSIFTLRNDVMRFINVRKAQDNNDFLQFYFKKRESQLSYPLEKGNMKCNEMNPTRAFLEDF